MADRTYNVLFLCTGNSARSILAECVLNRLGRPRFRAFSAGSFPKGEVHPYALDMLRRQNYPVSELRSKSWDEFAGPAAPRLDFVFTVCDRAAAEVCPIWPGQPMSAHWGLPDPAAAQGSEAERRLAFADTLRMLTNRISIFVSLPLASLDKLTLQKRLDAIGTANMECCSRVKRILVRTRAVDRWHRYLQLPKIHDQLSSVMVPVVEDQRPHQSDTRSRKDLPLSLSGSPHRCRCLVIKLTQPLRGSSGTCFQRWYEVGG